MSGDETQPQLLLSPKIPVSTAGLTHERIELLAWLRRNNAASLAELYEGAIRPIFERPLPGRVRFVSHAVREIRNRLPDVISGVKGSGPLQYKNKLDAIAKRWQKSGFRLDGSLPDTGFNPEDAIAPSPEIGMPRDLFLSFAILLKEHEETRTRPLDTAFRLFEACAPENATLRDTLRPIVLQWIEVTEWFMKKAHDAGYVDADTDEQEFVSRFELFETYLSALVRGFFNTVDELDAILEDTNS